ncbi:MAG: HNH endonuclease [Candidatus Hodarchaeota archaeon]
MEGAIVTNWEEAILLFQNYLAAVLQDTKMTAREKIESRVKGIRYLLRQMPDLASKDIEEITNQVWTDCLRTFKKSDKGNKRTWADLKSWQKYKDLRACLVHARHDYTCHYCKERYSDTGKPLTVDHHIRCSKGYDEGLDNLFCCCRPCNTIKHTKSKQFLLDWLKRRGTR